MLKYKKQLQEAEELIHLQIEIQTMRIRKRIKEKLDILDFNLWKQNIKLEISNLKIWK